MYWDNWNRPLCPIRRSAGTEPSHPPQRWDKRNRPKNALGQKEPSPPSHWDKRNRPHRPITLYIPYTHR